MGLRDYLVLALGIISVPLALADAYLGLLAYSWLAFMRPQSLVWSMDVKETRLQFYVAIVLLFRVAFTPGPKVRLRTPTKVFLALWFWFGVSTLFSTSPTLSEQPFIDFCKVAIAVLLITGLVRERYQLKWLIVLLALCPGVWGVKFGQYFLFNYGAMSGHGGPMGQDNNDTALFIAMGIPLLVYATSEIRNRWGRLALYGAAGLSVPGIILTGSRGGLIALVVALVLTIGRKTDLWKAVLVGAVVAAGVMFLIPERQAERYETIETYEEDASAMGRIDAWKTCIEMAKARPLVGVGFGQDAYMQAFGNHNPHGAIPRAAHSVWFSLLAETGFVGLGIYVLLMVVCIRETHRVMKEVKELGLGRDHWAWGYSAGLQAALIVFAVAGSFLSKARFEYVFALMMTTVPLRMIWDEEREAIEAADEEGAEDDEAEAPLPIETIRAGRAV
jgi:probable O-glycosylation ligase (exosortase A-associated)